MGTRRTFHSHFRRINHHPRVSRLNRVEKVGMTAKQRKQTIFGVKILRLGNFDCSRPRRSDVEITDSQAGKNITFPLKGEPKIFLCELMNSKQLNRARQNQPMEDQKQGKKTGEGNPNATPPFSLGLR